MKEHLISRSKACAFGVVLAGLLIGPFVNPAGAQPSLDVFSWLVGEWVRDSSKGVVTESWTRVTDDTMEGVAYLAAKSETQITEYLRIERFGGDVFYIAKPSENPLPTPFKLIEHDGKQFIFENPDHDFPQRIIFRREGDDRLRVRIEGIMDGEFRAVDFNFEKKDQ